MGKRLISVLLSAVLLVGLLPVTAQAAGEHDSHSNNWTEFTADTTLSGGSYYLSGDVVYSGTEPITVISEVILCLNGHKLDLNEHHIYVGNGASLTLCDCSTGGVLTGGLSEQGGGVYVDSGGTFALTGGSIASNTAGTAAGTGGGGVYVNTGGTFTLTGGSIASNTAGTGGGVCVYKGGTFTMEGGSIHNNQATRGGGGGVMVNEGSFTMTGGSITGNATNSAYAGYGGGVCLYGTFYLSGDAIIQNNTKAAATDNLHLGWNTINITGPLGKNTHIGVTADGVPRSFISGWSDNMAGKNPADYFSSDGNALGIGLNAEGNVVLGNLCTTITLHPNGGTLPAHSLVEGVALPIPTKTGYTFAGWYANPELTGDPVTDVPTNNTENLNFYAKWTVTTYTITANASPAEGGSVTVNGFASPLSVTAGTDVTLSATANSGYRFTGWTSSNGGTFSNASSEITTFTTPAGNVTVTANWKKDEQTTPPPEPEPTPPPAPQPTPPSGGSGSPPSPSYYPPRVNQTAGGTVEITPARPQRGDTVTITATPDAGKMVSFVGATDRNGNVIEVTENGGIWTFTQPISVVTVGVVFVDEVQPWHNPFGDVQPDDWCYDAVQYVTENGLMTGTGMSAFSPNATSTRAMLWAILARQDGEEISGRAWEAQAQAWATAEGISDGTNPSGTLTREQLVTMLYRAAGSPQPSGDLSAFADAADVSAYAQAPLAWAVENGIVGGVGGNRVDPLGSATRAQLAAMLMRYA